MKKILVTVMVAVAMMFGTTGPVEAAVHKHYGESARKVAREIGCKRFVAKPRGVYNISGGVCYLKGRRVNVLTFRGVTRQGEWNYATDSLMPRTFWWANGKGAVVVARNGNKRSAVIGARRLPGYATNWSRWIFDYYPGK